MKGYELFVFDDSNSWAVKEHKRRKRVLQHLSRFDRVVEQVLVDRKGRFAVYSVSLLNTWFQVC